MSNRELIEKLKDQTTWRLVGLGIITYGIYLAFYVKRQTGKINIHLSKDAAISNKFIVSIFVMSFLSAALLIPYILVESGNPIEKISNLIDGLCGIMLVVWSFKARNRVNSLCSFNTESEGWFHGLWTFLFGPLYFNYKVNRLNENNAEQANTADR